MVFVELGIEARLLPCVDAHKMAPSRSLAVGTFVRQEIREWYSTPRLRNPVQLLHGSIVLTDPRFDIHEARGPFLTTQPRAKGQRLASPRKPNHLNTNTRIVPSSSCVEGKVRSGMGACAGAALRCVHFLPVHQWPLSGHPPGRCLDTVNR